MATTTYQQRSDEILDRWEVGVLSNAQAARDLWRVHRHSVQTAYWRRRDEGIEGLFFEAITKSLDTYNRGTRTKFLTLALLKLRDLVKVQDRKRTRETETRGEALVDPLERLAPNTSQFLEFLSGRLVSLQGRPLRGADLLRRRVLELILEDRTIKQAARSTRQTPETIVEILKDEYALLGLREGLKE